MNEIILQYQQEEQQGKVPILMMKTSTASYGRFAMKSTSAPFTQRNDRSVEMSRHNRDDVDARKRDVTVCRSVAPAVRRKPCRSLSMLPLTGFDERFVS